MAGPWLRYRGHLDNISNNCLIGAVNAFGGNTNAVVNQLDGTTDEVPNVAREYKDEKLLLLLLEIITMVKDHQENMQQWNQGTLGVMAVIVKSFARIHETNLKKQGMLGLTFANEADYDLIKEDDTFNFTDLNAFSDGKQLTLEVVHANGTTNTIILNHTYNEAQIDWFKAGSALNLIRKENS